jgi:hypothetical protein
MPTLAQHKSNESWNRYHPEDAWNGNNSRISSSKSYILTIPAFSKKNFYEDLLEIKNKTGPALLGT